MSTRRFRLPSPALVISLVALALVLGGTAVAASKTLDPDKKADTQLIHRLAPTLSVHSARVATYLGGKTAASLETSAYTYTLPDTFGTAADAVEFPGLPGGIYYASYDIAWHMDTSAQSVGCYFLIDSADYALSYSAPEVGQDYVSTSGSGVIDTQSNAPQFICFASAGSFVPDNAVSGAEITLVPVDTVQSAAATFSGESSSHR